MGKNVPKKQGEKSDDEDQNKDQEGNKNGAMAQINGKSHYTKGKSSVILVFRGVFDTLLKYKYSFYQNSSTPNDSGVTS